MDLIFLGLTAALIALLAGLLALCDRLDRSGGLS